MLCAICNPKLLSTIEGHLPISPLSPTKSAPQLLSILRHLIFIFILSRWGCLTSWTLFLCNEPFWLPHYPTKKKAWRLPKTKVSLEDGVNPLWSTYIREKMTTLGKTSVVLSATSGGTHLKLGDLSRTWKEHIENMKKVKKFNVQSHAPLKAKPRVFWMHAPLSYCLGRISIPTFVCHHFQTIQGLTHASIN
jgi:hypothetical protein